MSINDSEGCNSRHKFGWIAVGYNQEDDFWFLSGVFKIKKFAIEYLLDNFEVDQYSAVRIPLLRTTKNKLRGR